MVIGRGRVALDRAPSVAGVQRSTGTALLVVTTALSGAVLVLLTPSFFDGTPPPAWVLWPVVGVLVASGAALVLHRSQP